jgi:predicted CoA-substrate-specific enzyme activase
LFKQAAPGYGGAQGVPDTLTAGVDAGSKFTRAVLVRDGTVVSRGLAFSGFDRREAAGNAYAQALREAGLERGEVSYVMATGEGKGEISFAAGTVSEVSAAARGAVFLNPQARTVVDVGAEVGRALKVDEKGNVLDFTINEKCAAGTGSFVETMSRALEIPLEELGPLSLRSGGMVTINAQCAVFAESEVISLIHAKTPKQDIARAIHTAMAARISSLARRVGLQQEILIIGGLAKNPGFVRALEEELAVPLLVPGDPEYVTALGAALSAAAKAGRPQLKPKTPGGK